jgi:hypothetical protein
MQEFLDDLKEEVTAMERRMEIINVATSFGAV